MPPRHRPDAPSAQVVLYHLARWHRYGDHPVSETVEQIAEEQRLGGRTVRRCLAALEAAGLVVSVRRGGRGHGTARVLTFVATEAAHAAVGEDATEAAHAAAVEDTSEPELRPRTHRTAAASTPTAAAQRGRYRRFTDVGITDVGIACAQSATSSNGAPRQRRRRNGDEPDQPKAPAGGDETRRRADAVVRPWWERQAPRPAQPFVAIVGVCAGALRAGWTDVDLAQALEEVPVVSGGALDLWRNKRAKGPPHARARATADGGRAVADAIAARRRALHGTETTP
jgi:DNA-binding transcriptional ArsR family regulator